MTTEQKQLRLNIRNFLIVATPEELAKELVLSQARGDAFRAQCVQELIDELPQLTPNDYQWALDAQNASNLSGLVFSLARIMKKINADNPNTEARNRHPIVRLFLEQMAFLCGGDWNAAYALCLEEASKHKPAQRTCPECEEPYTPENPDQPACKQCMADAELDLANIGETFTDTRPYCD